MQSWLGRCARNANVEWHAGRLTVVVEPHGSVQAARRVKQHAEASVWHDSTNPIGRQSLACQLVDLICQPRFVHVLYR